MRSTLVISVLLGLIVIILTDAQSTGRKLEQETLNQNATMVESNIEPTQQNIVITDSQHVIPLSDWKFKRSSALNKNKQAKLLRQKQLKPASKNIDSKMERVLQQLKHIQFKMSELKTAATKHKSVLKTMKRLEAKQKRLAARRAKAAKRKALRLVQRAARLKRTKARRAAKLVRKRKKRKSRKGKGRKGKKRKGRKRKRGKKRKSKKKKRKRKKRKRKGKKRKSKKRKSKKRKGRKRTSRKRKDKKLGGLQIDMSAIDVTPGQQILIDGQSITTNDNNGVLLGMANGLQNIDISNGFPVHTLTPVNISLDGHQIVNTPTDKGFSKNGRLEERHNVLVGSQQPFQKSKQEHVFSIQDMPIIDLTSTDNFWKLTNIQNSSPTSPTNITVPVTVSPIPANANTANDHINKALSGDTVMFFSRQPTHGILPTDIDLDITPPPSIGSSPDDRGSAVIHLPIHNTSGISSSTSQTPVNVTLVGALGKQATPKTVVGSDSSNISTPQLTGQPITPLPSNDSSNISTSQLTGQPITSLPSNDSSSISTSQLTGQPITPLPSNDSSNISTSQLTGQPITPLPSNDSSNISTSQLTGQPITPLPSNDSSSISTSQLTGQPITPLPSNDSSSISTSQLTGQPITPLPSNGSSPDDSGSAVIPLPIHNTSDISSSTSQTPVNVTLVGALGMPATPETVVWPNSNTSSTSEPPDVPMSGIPTNRQPWQPPPAGVWPPPVGAWDFPQADASSSNGNTGSTTTASKIESSSQSEIEKKRWQMIFLLKELRNKLRSKH